jgi:hypothetical protein
MLTALQAQRKGWAFATSAVLLILLAQSIRLGAPDLPPAYTRLLNPMTAPQWRPAAAREHLTVVRNGFESTPGATTIGKGDALVQPDRGAAVKRPRYVASAVGDVLPQPRPAPAPSSFASRVVTGSAAMLLPRVLGESLGLIRLGGGRGLWIFAEADTVVFLLVLLYAIVFSTRNLIRGRAKLTATFVFCVIVFVLTAGPMLYTVNNFGTLFRLRLMVYCVAAILPITLRHQDDAVQ